jgi:hypothetical protein
MKTEKSQGCKKAARAFPLQLRIQQTISVHVCEMLSFSQNKWTAVLPSRAAGQYHLVKFPSIHSTLFPFKCQENDCVFWEETQDFFELSVTLSKLFFKETKKRSTHFLFGKQPDRTFQIFPVFSPFIRKI